MKTMKTIITSIAATIAALTLSNCASVQSAAVADYNGDGVVSRAEAAQYHRQKDIEDRNVYTESNKRRNAVNTVRDVRDVGWAARSIRNTARYW
jgi:hypothetical protein